MSMKNLYFRAVQASIFGFLAMTALLFLPAGTLDYWQAFVFMAVFVGATAAITVYLALKDPKLLERRMRVGPTAEKQPTQKIIMVFALVGFIALLVVSAFDRRFMWSPVSPFVSVIGDFLVALGFLLVYFVVRENSYAASTIQVAEGQTVVSSGPYAVVRHPMYAGTLPLVVGTPLALGSWSGLFALILFVPALIWRLLDEEKFLNKNLPGYTEYTRKVRYRLLPFIW
jgi:protein-S-isoprenylcysteine O-methyltransferase Ste14